MVCFRLTLLRRFRPMLLRERRLMQEPTLYTLRPVFFGIGGFLPVVFPFSGFNTFAGETNAPSNCRFACGALDFGGNRRFPVSVRIEATDEAVEDVVVDSGGLVCVAILSRGPVVFIAVRLMIVCSTVKGVRMVVMLLRPGVRAGVERIFFPLLVNFS